MEKNKKFLIVLIVASLLLAVFPVLAGVPTEPHDANAMWIEPSSINLSTDVHSVGYKFNITVWLNVSSVSSTNKVVGAWQYVVTYNKSMLNATGTGYTAGAKSQFFENITSYMPPGAPAFKSLNATHNYVMHAESWLAGPKRVMGYGSLGWVEFEVMAAPPEGGVLTGLLDLRMTGVPKCKILDDAAGETSFNPYPCVYTFTSGLPPIPPPVARFSWSPTTPDVGETVNFDGSASTPDGGTLESYEWDFGDGTSKVKETDPFTTHVYSSSGLFTVTLNVTDSEGKWDTESKQISIGAPPPVGARLYVDPPEIIDPTMLPSSIFTINITIDDVTNMTVCEFNLTYNPIVLGWIGIGAFKVQGQFPTTQLMLNDEAGFIWVKLTYATPVTTSNPVPLVKIDFHVDALGSSPLDLHDTHLTDSQGQPIPHTAEDGFFQSLIRDVAITNVVPFRDWVYQGWTVNINVTAKNKGDINETFTVTAKYNGNQIGNFTVNNLPPGNETIIVFAWNTSNVVACHNYTISAQASIVPYELNTTNNEYIDGKIKVRILGDINKDGIVDISDIYAVAQAFGTFPGHPNWNPDADINQDSMIDIQDIYLVAINFGKRCSQ